MKESAWDSFLKALEETTPEVMEGLKGKPFEVFRELEAEYKKVSLHKFGSHICEVDGRPIIAIHPFSDLAQLICSPNFDRFTGAWPPSAAFLEPTMQPTVLKLATAMRAWAANFLDPQRNPHFRFVTVALGTMNNWLEQPKTIEVGHWLGQARVIRAQGYQPQKFNLGFDGWNPQVETEEAFRSRVKEVRKNVNHWAKSYVAEIRSLFLKYDTKRNPEHYHWAALRLASEMTYPRITETWGGRAGESLTLDEGTVRKGVRAVLKILDLKDIKANRK
jgi:hypothetical protein